MLLLIKSFVTGLLYVYQLFNGFHKQIELYTMIDNIPFIIDPLIMNL